MLLVLFPPLTNGLDDPPGSFGVLMRSTFTFNHIVCRLPVQYKLPQLWLICGSRVADEVVSRVVSYLLTPMLAIRTTSQLNY